jgi:hypothetical protein
MEKMAQIILMVIARWGVSRSLNLTLLCFYPFPNPTRASGAHATSRQRKPSGSPNHHCSLPIPSQIRIALFSSYQQGA